MDDYAVWDRAERLYGKDGLWLGRRPDGSVEVRKFGVLQIVWEK